MPCGLHPDLTGISLLRLYECHRQQKSYHPHLLSSSSTIPLSYSKRPCSCRLVSIMFSQFTRTLPCNIETVVLFSREDWCSVMWLQEASFSFTYSLLTAVTRSSKGRSEPRSPPFDRQQTRVLWHSRSLSHYPPAILIMETHRIW